MLRFSSSPGTQTQTVTQTETQTHTHNERFQQDEFAMKEIIAYECEKKKTNPRNTSKFNVTVLINSRRKTL